MKQPMLVEIEHVIQTIVAERNRLRERRVEMSVRTGVEVKRRPLLPVS